jgi:ABC-type lipoprotein export system ATPase subunit
VDKLSEYEELERQAANASPTVFGDGAVIVCDNLVKIYKVADLEAIALQGLDLTIAQGEFVAIVGVSGSGKSTLLRILGGLEEPSAGQARVAGIDLMAMDVRQRTTFRRDIVGFVWQQTARNLLPYLTALENVETPLTLSRRLSRQARRDRATLLLEQVGMQDRLDHRPNELSGGEQQRVAIAIALANEPRVIFADEPTGELDSRTAAEVIDVLRRVNEENGVTIVVVTHDPVLAGQVERTVAIRDGRLSSEVLRRRTAGANDDEVVAEEFAVLDRVGRLQLPADYVDALALEHRVRLTLDTDRINVFPGIDESGNDDDQ